MLQTKQVQLAVMREGRLPTEMRRNNSCASLNKNLNPGLHLNMRLSQGSDSGLNDVYEGVIQINSIIYELMLLLDCCFTMSQDSCEQQFDKNLLSSCG